MEKSLRKCYGKGQIVIVIPVNTFGNREILFWLSEVRKATLGSTADPKIAHSVSRAHRVRSTIAYLVVVYNKVFLYQEPAIGRIGRQNRR